MKKVYFPQLFTLAILLFVSAAVLAQDATLSGTVRDKKNGESLPIVSVSVQIGEQRRGAETDFDGLYSLKVPAGTHTVTFSLVGYEAVKETVTVSAGETKTLDVSLGESSNLLETVVVTGTKFEQKLGEQTVSLEVIKSNLADRVNNTAIDQTIEKVPGVTVIDGQANIRGGSGFSYGAGSRVMLLMDDLPILTADAGFPRWSFLPVENMEQIEIIKGASSALYGSSALNGIINIRTAYPKSEPVTKFSMFSGIYQNPRNNNYYVYDKTTKAVKDTLQKAWWGNEQPHEEGFSFAHRQKFGQLDFVTGGYFFNQKSWRRKRI
jgi:outer membrane cobalamin receptor